MISKNDTTPYWIGASEREQESVWKWTDKSNFMFKNWAKGQPQKFPKSRPEGDEDCGVINYGKEKEWHSELCNKMRPFICERPFGANSPMENGLGMIFLFILLCLCCCFILSLTCCCYCCKCGCFKKQNKEGTYDAPEFTDYNSTQNQSEMKPATVNGVLVDENGIPIPTNFKGNKVPLHAQQLSTIQQAPNAMI